MRSRKKEQRNAGQEVCEQTLIEQSLPRSGPSPGTEQTTRRKERQTKKSSIQEKTRLPHDGDG